MREPAGGRVGELARDGRGLERRQARPEIVGDCLALVPETTRGEGRASSATVWAIMRPWWRRVRLPRLK